MKNIYTLFLIALFAVNSFSATWKGKNIDGVEFDAEIYSYKQSKFYTVTVEFSGADCIIHWSNGGHITVEMDSPKIKDIHNISAFHSKTSSFYDIDIDGLD